MCCICQGLGEEPAIKDLDSSPWKNALQRLTSAKKRAGSDEWRWRQIINKEENIMAGRKPLGHPPQPFSKEHRDLAAAAKKEGKQKKKQKKGDVAVAEDE